jgi:site-specific recombinase XerD
MAISNPEEEQRQREKLAEGILNKMIISSGNSFTTEQITELKQSLQTTLSKYQVQEDTANQSIIDAQQENARVLRMFIDAKRIEGRTNTTLYNYAKEVSKLFLCLNKHYKNITATDIREYLSWRKDTSNLKSASIANIRMYLLSFFKWLWKEELIIRNPMDKIGVIKTETHVIQTLSDEEQEVIRCACTNERDRAIIDLLSGSGMRVSELCGLNKSDVNFELGEVKVFGKGQKERICFLTGRCKVHLKWYLDERTDNNPALFVTANKPYDRLTKNGVEYILRQIAKKSKIPTIRLYPHKYRSTLATNVIKRGGTLEQAQKLLGHCNTSVTQLYARMDTGFAKDAHNRFVE